MSQFSPDIEKKLVKAMNRLDSSFYFYDLDFLKKHLEYIAENLHPSIKLWYACKANPLSAILKVLRNLDFGIDVASFGELNQVISSGVEPNDILSTGPSKSRKYLGELLDHDVNIIVAESLNQVYWLDEISNQKGKKPQVLLRVQLDWEEGSSVLGGDQITPFGIDSEQWLSLDMARTSNIDIVGYHVFQWGNILDLKRLEKIWWKITETLLNLSNKMNIPMQVIDLGGGLGIPYTSEQKAIDFKDVNTLLLKLKKEFSLSTIWMELGRYTVGQCGYYFTQVIDRKIVRGKSILVTDGGINHIARPALTDEPFPCHLFRSSDKSNEEFQVHGPLCTALDNLGTFSLSKDVDCGDWLVFSQAGAYGFTEAMPFFLCHNLPAELVYYSGDMMTPRNIKTSADWLV